MKKIFLLEWDGDNLGQDWMNIYNLELCLYSKEHTNRDLLKISEIINPYENLPEGIERYPSSTFVKMLEEWAEEATERLKNKDPNSLY